VAVAKNEAWQGALVRQVLLGRSVGSISSAGCFDLCQGLPGERAIHRSPIADLLIANRLRKSR